jgi:hypothetical protein
MDSAGLDDYIDAWALHPFAGGPDGGDVLARLLVRSRRRRNRSRSVAFASVRCQATDSSEATATTGTWQTFCVRSAPEAVWTRRARSADRARDRIPRAGSDRRQQCQAM